MFTRRQTASAVHSDEPTRGPDAERFHAREFRRILLAGAACTVFATAVGTSVSVAAAAPAGQQPVHTTQAPTHAPSLTLSGTTLTWLAISGVRSYELATIHNLTTTRDTTYQVITGTSFTPTAAPGQTVGYSLRAYVSGSNWSGVVDITWPATQAPALTLSANTLLWTAVTGVSTYQVATILNPTTTRNTTYQTVTGTSFAPPAVPGQTVNYNVRTYVSGSLWASEVSITWPAPVVNPKLKVGVMDVGNYNYPPLMSASVFSAAGISYTREDVDRGQQTGSCTATDYVCVALRNSITPLVLFEGYADSNMSAEIVALAQKLNKLAVSYPAMNRMHVLEFGNEVWAGTSGPAENAATYGAQYNAAHAALAAAGLGNWKLLAIGNGLGTCVNSHTSANWINRVIAAQSARAAGIDGWTVHPYGPVSTDFGCGAPGQGYGWPEVVDYHNIAVKAGSNAPWYVTEVGQCLGGSGCNTSVSMGAATDLPEGVGPSPYYTQAADMTQYMTDAGGDTRTATAAKYPWIAALIWYQAYDDGSGWFGLLSNGSNLSQPVDYQRPAFTALHNWIAANGEG